MAVLIPQIAAVSQKREALRFFFSFHLLNLRCLQLQLIFMPKRPSRSGVF